MKAQTRRTNENQSSATPEPDGCLLKIAQAAKRIGVSVSWLKQNPTALPYVRVGKKLKRWRVQDIDAYIARNVRNAQ